MKTILLLAIALLFAITSITAQEGNIPCKAGVLIGNPSPPYVIAYSKVFDTKCKKVGRLSVLTGMKSQIRVQFFTHLEKTAPHLLEPFRKRRVSSIEIWVVDSDAAFEQQIDQYFDTAHKDYDITLVEDFKLKPIAPNPFQSEIYLSGHKKMYAYLQP